MVFTNNVHMTLHKTLADNFEFDNFAKFTFTANGKFILHLCAVNGK